MDIKVTASTNQPIAHAVGRRKACVARVWLKRGKGKITVNNKTYAEYFDTDAARLAAYQPFTVYPNGAKLYDVIANVSGGGLIGQADAVKLAISRALLQANDTIKPILKEQKLLTVDSRVKERKKYGQKGARRKFQFVKR